MQAKNVLGCHRLVLALYRLAHQIEPDKPCRARQQGGGKNAGLGHQQQATVTLYASIFNLFTSLSHLLGAFNSNE